jgi:hypothetical protein
VIDLFHYRKRVLHFTAKVEHIFPELVTLSCRFMFMVGPNDLIL